MITNIHSFFLENLSFLNTWTNYPKANLLLASVVIFFIFLFLRGVFSFLIFRQVNNMLLRKHLVFQEKLAENVEKPVKFIPIVLGIYFALKFYGINFQEQLIFSKLIKVLTIFNVFWFIYSLVEPFTYVFLKAQNSIGKTAMSWISKVLKVLVFLFGTISILDILGLPVTSILASLGIVGMAVALGAQDMFKNIIAGIAILTEKRFAVGDYIKMDGAEIEGIVQRIGFRSTLIKMLDKSPVYIPNSKLSDEGVINYSLKPHRRIVWTLNIEYRASADQLKYIRDKIAEYLKKNKDFVAPPEAAQEVRVAEFGASSIDIFVLCFANTNDFGVWMKVKEELLLRIKEIVEDEAGAGFAFPSTSMYIEKQDTTMKYGKINPTALKNWKKK